MTQSILHRLFGAAAAVALVSAAAAGCSSSSGDSAKSTTTVAAATQTTTAPSATDSPAVKEITDAFVNFFDARTPAETKVGLLENGSALSPAIVQQSGSSMASGSAATVSSVSLDDATHASVVYTILMNGAPALPNQSGKAISIDGHWKVAVATYCSLLKMQGPVPAAC